MNPTHDQNVSPSKEQLSETTLSKIKLALRNEPEVQKLARSIDEQDIIKILEYGTEPALEVSRFSDHFLAIMLKDNLENPGHILKQLEKIMDRFDKKDFEKVSGGLFSRLFRKSEKMKDRLYEKYQFMGKEIEQLYVKISEYKGEVAETTNRLERMYEQNHQNYLILEKYIVAAELKLSELKANKLPKLEQNSSNGDQKSSMELDSLRNCIEVLEQKIIDLGLAKMVALQTAPQLKLLHRGNEKLIGKINSAFVSTIPIFKNGLMQAVAAKRQKLVAGSMKELDRRTNEMMTKNAEKLARQRVDIARLSGTPGIKIETIEECFNIILKGMQETKVIEEENKRLRQEGKRRINELQENFKKSKQQ